MSSNVDPPPSGSAPSSGSIRISISKNKDDSNTSNSNNDMSKSSHGSISSSQKAAMQGSDYSTDSASTFSFFEKQKQQNLINKISSEKTKRNKNVNPSQEDEDGEDGDSSVFNQRESTKSSSNSNLLFGEEQQQLLQRQEALEQLYEHCTDAQSAVDVVFRRSDYGIEDTERIQFAVTLLDHIKIVLVGPFGVGKSSFLRALIGDDFNEEYQATIGVDYSLIKIHILGIPLVINIWDASGHSEFESMRREKPTEGRSTGQSGINNDFEHSSGDCPNFYEGCQGVVMMFDLTSKRTFTELQNGWLVELAKGVFGYTAMEEKDGGLRKPLGMTAVAEINGAYFEGVNTPPMAMNTPLSVSAGHRASSDSGEMDSSTAASQRSSNVFGGTGKEDSWRPSTIKKESRVSAAAMCRKFQSRGEGKSTVLGESSSSSPSNSSDEGNALEQQLTRRRPSNKRKPKRLKRKIIGATSLVPQPHDLAAHMAKSKSLSRTQIAVVGTKSELKKERLVSFSEAEDWAYKYCFSYDEVSVKEKKGIWKVFAELVYAIVTKQM